LAHELRQPLSTIESIAYYLGMVAPPENKRVREQVDKLHEVVQQASWILSDAVHFFQASPPAPQLVNLEEFVSEGLAGAFKQDGWIRVELSGAPVLVRLDPEQARHMFRNLLYFFRRITRPEPRLLVRTAVAGGTARLEFRATGLNCTLAELQAMFGPFSSHVPAGSGLALASVKRIVEVHDGRITLDSGEDGEIRLEILFPSAG